MNTSNTRHPSGPECARYALLLPQLRQGLLAPAEDAALRAHLATCAHCQERLAAYDRLDAALSTYIDRFARTAPTADDLVGVAVTRAAAATPTWASQRDSTMFDSRDTTYETPTLPQMDRQPPHHSRTRPVLATIVAVLLIGLAATLFAMFGRPSTGPAHGSTPTATTQPTATPAPTEQPTQPTTIGVVTSGHPCGTDTSGQVRYVQIGDLKVREVDFALAYPANQLPASLDPSKPYRLPDLPNPPNPPVNPTGSYALTICNTSATTSHVIRSLTVRIAAFSAYSGPLNTYMFCDSFYQRPSGVGGGGCGGGFTADELLKASFAADATTGAQATTTQDSTGGPDVPPLPVQLGPGQMLVINVSVTPPTAPGTYTFAFGLNYDGVTSAPISTMQPTIFDSAAVKWNGQNCTKPALSGQIPTNDTTGRYVCAP